MTTIRHWALAQIMFAVSLVRSLFGRNQTDMPMPALSLDAVEPETVVARPVITALALAPEYNTPPPPLPEQPYPVASLEDCDFSWADFAMGTMEITLPGHYQRYQVNWVMREVMATLKECWLYEKPVFPGFVYRRPDNEWIFSLKGVDLRGALSIFGGYDQKGNYWHGCVTHATT